MLREQEESRRAIRPQYSCDICRNREGRKEWKQGFRLPCGPVKTLPTSMGSPWAKFALQRDFPIGQGLALLVHHYAQWQVRSSPGEATQENPWEAQYRYSSVFKDVVPECCQPSIFPAVGSLEGMLGLQTLVTQWIFPLKPVVNFIWGSSPSKARILWKALQGKVL